MFGIWYYHILSLWALTVGNGCGGEGGCDFGGDGVWGSEGSCISKLKLKLEYDYLLNWPSPPLVIVHIREDISL